jgi:hypothetical protein
MTFGYTLWIRQWTMAPILIGVENEMFLFRLLVRCIALTSPCGLSCFGQAQLHPDRGVKSGNVVHYPVLWMPEVLWAHHFLPKLRQEMPQLPPGSKCPVGLQRLSISAFSLLPHLTLLL